MPPPRVNNGNVTYNERADILWPILAGLAQERRTETYGVVGREIGHGAQGVGGALAPIHSFCERNRLPLLTALVVQAATRRPGGGYESANDHRTECERVFAFDWSTVPPPYAGDFPPVT